MNEVERALQKHGYSTGDASREAIISELLQLETLVTDLCEAARKDAQETTGDPWSVVYDVVFSEKVSRRVFALCDSLGPPLEYYDPDENYDDDVLAFSRAFTEYVDRFRPAPEEERRSEYPSFDDCGCGQRWCSTCN